jgi:hypothetical protein
MPVIRGEPTVKPITPDRRQQLLEQLQAELQGTSTPGGPLIFEIPLSQSTQTDVLVVWDKFEGLSSGDRTNVILDAYTGRSIAIALAMGVTVQEALEQQLLPYALGTLPDTGNTQAEAVRQAMIEEGALVQPSGKVQLRLPTLAMAQKAFERLNHKLPDVRWAIQPTLVGGAAVDW